MQPFMLISLIISTPLLASHFEIPKPRPLQMVIADEPLQLFGDLKSYEQDATHYYFGNKKEIAPSTLCARFILKELGELQYCTYVPVHTALHQKTLITTIYELHLVADSSGTDPHKLIEKLCQRYTHEKQATGAEGEKKS